MEIKLSLTFAMDYDNFERCFLDYAAFEKLMKRILKGLEWKTWFLVLNSINIFGKNFHQHLKNLLEVLL